MISFFSRLFQNRYLFLAYIVWVIISGIVWWYFTDVQVMYGNYGPLHTNFDIFLSICMIVGFPLFLVEIIYKWLLFGSRETMHTRTGLGIATGLIGTIISGASCCGPTLAIYFWLLPLMNILPYDGLELKLLSLLGLAYALWDTSRHLDSCRVVQKKSKK